MIQTWQVIDLQLSDNEFFEEYKHLEKLCSEIYSCQNGISEYITQMEDRYYQGQSHVFSWDADYKMLKHVRWVRNQIAHDSGTYQISEPEDLDFVRDFHDRIFSGHDPLTSLRKAIKAESEQKRQIAKPQPSPVPTPTISHPPYTPPIKKRSYKWVGALIGALIVVAALILIFLLLYYTR